MRLKSLYRNLFLAPVILAALALMISANRCSTKQPQAAKIKFTISFPQERSKMPLDGRMLLLISTNDTNEPRLQINDGANTQLIFGVDVDGLQPGQEAVIDTSVFGYPLKSISEIPAGEYYVQGLLNRYETFHRSDGHNVKLPMDQGEGQRWSAKPGNLYSTPKKVAFDPLKNEVIKVSLDKEIPPIPPPQDTKYIKHEKIQSKLLTEFWGRPMHLGACILLPEGFDTHPEARYPLIIMHGHFPRTFGGFRETPPDPELKPDYSERFRLAGYNKIEQEYAYQFYKDWTS
ncbi:MAG: hypothetical protein NTV82_02220, partial [Candidatus Aminicenantes bacterium]|nr:hypothetical protein [Candidatus Aminicenantes bacterium]